MSAASTTPVALLQSLKVTAAKKAIGNNPQAHRRMKLARKLWEQIQLAKSQAEGTNFTLTGDLLFGIEDQAGSNAFDGQLDEFRIWDHVRTEQQIQAKREMLLEKQKTLKRRIQENEYLEGVNNDYNKYYNYFFLPRQRETIPFDFI